MRAVPGLAMSVLLAACFSESNADTSTPCPKGSNGCACRNDDACDPGLECSMDACVVPGCTPGELACNCFENQCFGALVCERGACHEPPMSTGSSGAESSPTSGTTAASDMSMSLTDAMPTSSSSDTGLVACGDELECQACKDCATLGPCADQLAMCELEPECAALVECLSACGDNDNVCASDCGMAHPDGIPQFEPVAMCVVCECRTPCPTKAVCE